MIGWSRQGFDAGVSMKVREAIRVRRSTRAFLDTPLPEGLLREVLDKARAAPSNSNMQPWLAHVVTGDTLARLKAATAARSIVPPAFDERVFGIYPDPPTEAQEARRFACGERQYGARGIARQDGAGRLRYVYNNHQCFGAPAALFLFAEPKDGPSQWADLGIFLQTVMLLLTEAGLGCCAQISWTAFHETVKDVLGVPPRLTLYCGLSIGFPDPADPINAIIADRAELAEIVTFHD